MDEVLGAQGGLVDGLIILTMREQRTLRLFS